MAAGPAKTSKLNSRYSIFILFQSFSAPAVHPSQGQTQALCWRGTMVEVCRNDTRDARVNYVPQQTVEVSLQPTKSNAQVTWAGAEVTSAASKMPALRLPSCLRPPFSPLTMIISCCNLRLAFDSLLAAAGRHTGDRRYLTVAAPPAAVSFTTYFCEGNTCGSTPSRFSHLASLSS